MKRYAALLLAAVVGAAAAAPAAQATPASDVPASLPRKGLVAFWTADGHAKDSVGKNHGKLTKGVSYTTDRHGEARKAFVLNGQPGVSVIVPDAAELDLGDKFTLSAWIRPHKIAPISRAVVSKPGAYQMGIHRGGEVWFQFSARGERWPGNHVTSPAQKLLNRWTHIASTYDHDKLRMYVNGELVATKNVGAKRVLNSHDTFLISSDGNVPFHGAIDDVGIWNRALGPEEIRAVAGLAGGGVHPVARGLVGLWLADGNAKDHLGKHHGTFCGGATCGPGKFGKAFKFDGKDDYLAMGDVLDWGKGSWSVCLWYKRTSSSTKGMTLLRKGLTSAGTPKDAGYALLTLSNRIEFRVCGPSQGEMSAAGKEPSTNEWHHVAGVLDRKAAKVYLYLDGKLAGANAVTGVGNLDTNMPLAVGMMDRGRFGRRDDPFEGAVDEVAMWKRALSADEVRAVFEGLPAGLPQVTRKADMDRVALKDGNILLGTIENRKYTVSAFFGRIEVPAKDVVGLVQADKQIPHPRLILTSGQVVAGKLTAKTVQVLLPGADSPLQVPVGSIREFGYRISKEKPPDPTSPGAMVVLRSGDRLAWTEIKHKLQLVTSYATVDLPTGGIRTIELGGKTPRGRRVQLANGSTLTGTLLPNRLKLKLKLGPVAEVHDVQLLGLLGPARPVAPVGGTTMVMRNGDRLLGRVADQTLTVRTSVGDAKVRTTSIFVVEFDPKKPSVITAKTWGGGVMTGRLVEPTIAFAIAPGGPTVKAKTAQIASITRTSALPPPEVLKKLEKLIAQLGAESYKDREAATKALIAMGKSIVPILKKHLNNPDPEIAQRLEEIIKALGG